MSTAKTRLKLSSKRDQEVQELVLFSFLHQHAVKGQAGCLLYVTYATSRPLLILADWAPRL